MLDGLSRYRDERLLVGFETSDDAGLFKMPDGRILVQTVDFITPVVDDAHTFGRIAALNSMSDVYAMGGIPITAMSVFSYNCSAEEGLIREIMQGACDELTDAGCTLLGGHTVSDDEIKAGFAVTGVIEDDKYYRNCDLRPGDVLIYTKAIGIGILTTAIKAGKATNEQAEEVTKEMLISNRMAAELLRSYDVSAVTDITGFGLTGHACEMAKGAGLSIEINKSAIHVMEGAADFASQFVIPGGALSNQQFLGTDCTYEQMQDNSHIIYFDPQTSGGLLIGVCEDDAERMLSTLKDSGYPHVEVIGTVLPGGESPVVIK